MNTCRSCGAPVIWTVTANEKRMPVDGEPSPDGTILVIVNNAGRRSTVLTGESLEEARADGRALYKSHFATCPNANVHRR